MIIFDHVSKVYPNGTVGLDDVNLTIQDGEFVAIIGRSGAGKSTLLRSVNRMHQITSGTLTVNGTDVSTLSGKSLRRFRRGIGMVFQSFNLVTRTTVIKNVLSACVPDMPFWRVLLGAFRKADKIKALESLDKVGILDKAYIRADQLSGGQQQRVALARILCSEPEAILLDEPFSALDAHLKSVLEQNLVSLFDAFDGTILYVSHDIDEALRFCDRIAVVEDGHVMEIGTGDDLVNNPQSQAGIKLSGCKNATRAEYVDAHHVRLPRWGITVETSREVSRDVKCLGVRAFYLEQVDGPGENVYRARVDRVSDSRFERTALLGFVDACRDEREILDRNEDEMKYLHQHMFWRVDKLRADEASLPNEGEELWIRIPKDRVYLVSR